MCDIISAISFAAGAASLCIKAIDSLKKFSHGVRNAEDDLREVVIRVQSSYNLLEMIRGLLIELKESNAHELAIAVPVDGLKETLQRILDMASDVYRNSRRIRFWRKLIWSLERSEALELVGRLTQHQDQLMHVLQAISIISQLRSQTSIARMIKEATDTAVSPDAFSEITLVKEETGEVGSDNLIRTWIGHVHTDVGQLADPYCSMRNDLADAAYFGAWDDVFDILERAKQRFDEHWANATRIKPRGDAMSYWTPMHQAVYMRAPRGVVERLIALGGFRTLRTKWTEFPYPNVTPLELAHLLKETELYDVLCPVIRNPVPATVLTGLEALFHKLIRQEAEHLVDTSAMYLPLLEPLTELDSKAVWFPIQCENEGAGYLYRLDGRDLMVRSRNMRSVGEECAYVVTEEEIYIVNGDDDEGVGLVAGE